jgi:hypothetical protein
MRRMLPPLVVLAVLIAAPPAWGGGFATVGLSSTPSGFDAGRPWRVDITILQHGRTPLTDLRPSVVIRSGQTERTISARETGKPGVYRAEVVFPRPGRWSYAVRDGFVPTLHTFAPVRIGAAASASAAAEGRSLAAGAGASAPAPAPDRGGPAWGLLAGAGLAFAAAGGVVAADRRRRRPAAPRGAPEQA